MSGFLEFFFLPIQFCLSWLPSFCFNALSVAFSAFVIVIILNVLAKMVEVVKGLKD